MGGNNNNVTFGFDIGIASVGWAVLAPDHIVALGVRAFDKAETAKEGEPLNLARRSARLMRRRLYRRAWRQTKVARLLKQAGLVASARVLRDPAATPVSPWKLRVDALDRPLAPEEWARVIYHLCKHRGFHWISRAEEKKASEDTKGEGGKVKKGLAATAKLMQDKGYRTAAEMVLAEFPEAQRNKQGEYTKALSRLLLADELRTLFERQRELGNPHADLNLQTAILGADDRKSGLFWMQKPALSGENLLKMLGKCTFEKSEYRAPKSSFSAERHVWLTRLNNLRIVDNGETRPLNAQERAIALPLPYQRAGDLKHEHLRSALTKAGLWNERVRFAKFSYAPSDDGKAKDPEAEVLVKLPAWQELRKQLKDKGLETEWQALAGDALAGNPEKLDQIAWVLSVYKEDEEVARELNKLDLPGGQTMVDALSEIRFDKFSNLSLKALRQIVPHMDTGLRYDEACEKAGYHHSQLFKLGEGEARYLPPFYSGRDKDGRMIFNDEMDIPRNPVVLRALNQARKVMNALIRKYGSPAAVHIEMARDLSRPLDERRDIEKEQKAYRERNDKDKALFAEEFGQPPKGQEFEKWRLYREQQGKSIYPSMTEGHGICAYSLAPIDLNRLLEPGYVEIDHALPYSRSFDDSKNNKVLVLAKENRDKGNRTPYEYLDGVNNSERWQAFVAYVEGNKAYRQAKRNRLLRKNFGKEEAEGFRERNLNDTRYICKFFKNYVERYLKLADGSESKRCVVLSGQLTAFLRARWGLLKVRSDSDRHHALDAFVVAACSHGMVKRLSDYSRRKELEAVRDGFVDLETGEIVNHDMHKQLKAHFPDPWTGFRHELEARLFEDDPVKLRAAVEGLGTYSPEELDALKPLFVSRAPQRRNGGAAHMDTIYTKPRKNHVLMVKDKKAKKPKDAGDEDMRRAATMDEKLGMAIERIGVTDKDSTGNYKLTLEKLENLVDLHRNKRTAEVLQQWILNRDAREKEAKSIEANLGRGKERRPPTEEEKTRLEFLRSLPRKPLKTDPENGPYTGPTIRKVKVNAGKMSGIQIRNGIAAQESLLRIDIFEKESKFYLVPLYVADAVKNELPHSTADGETRINDSFVFRFALHPNDLVKVTLKGKGSILGYFRGYGGPPNPYNITLAIHDRNKNGHERANEKGEIPSIGVKTALKIEKFNVDILGNIYPAPPEKRRELA